MDEAIEKKKHRLAYAVNIKDTSSQWDLIVAGVEEGVIDCFGLEGKEATKMKERSQITFNKKSKGLLKGNRGRGQYCRPRYQRRMATHSSGTPHEVCQ